MAYETVQPAYYEFRQPGTPWQAGSRGWTQSPWVTWGINPNQMSTPRLAVNGCATCGIGAVEQWKTWAGWAAGFGLLAVILWPRKKVMRANRRRWRSRRRGR